MSEAPYAKHVSTILRRAAEYEAADEAWRASEVLQGAIRQRPFSAEVFEAYGRVLNRLGDRLEAGKYLFLSGARDDAAREAVELFLDRHARTHPNDLVAQFPGFLRSTSLAELPDIVLEELEVRGFDVDRMARARPEAETLEDAIGASGHEPWWSTLFSMVMLLGVAAVVLLLLGGVLRAALTIFDFFVGVIVG